MEVQLLVDNTVYGHYLRRLHQSVPGTNDAYIFEASVQNLPPGPHTFTERARLLDQAVVYVGGYTTSVGAPASLYQSAKATASDLLTIYSYASPQGWTSLTSSALSINQAVAVDLALQGYAQLDAAPGAQTILFRFVVDGVVVQRQSLTAVSPVLADGINVVDHWLNLTAGPHTIQLQAATDGGTATLEWRQVEYVAFPRDAITSPASEAAVSIGAGAACNVSSDDASGSCDNQAISSPPQPIAAVQQGLGKWTLLAETTLPLTASGNIGSWAIDGYIQFRGGIPGQAGPGTWGQLAFETITHDGPPVCTDKAVDMAIFNFVIPAGSPGLWVYGDAGQWGVSDSHCSPSIPTRVRLWIRPVWPGNSFLVGDRYFSVKIIPPGDCACTFDDPPAGAGLYTVAPCRIADTRGPVGQYGGPALQGLQARRFRLTGVCGIPPSAKAVAANVTVTQSTQAGVLEFFPTGHPPAGTTSTINYASSQTRANNATLPLECDGQVDIIPFQGTSTTVHVILDVVGYYQ